VADDEVAQRRRGGPHLKRTWWTEESIGTASGLWLQTGADGKLLLPIVLSRTGGSKCYVSKSQKPTLDKDQVSNYRSISKLSHTSKIIERVLKWRLTKHLVSSGLLNPHQSACLKHHSTKTTLLYIHDHFINAVGSQKLSCLSLLDPSTITSKSPAFLLSLNSRLCRQLV